MYKGWNKSIQRNKLRKWRELFDKTNIVFVMQREKAIKIKYYSKREEGNGLNIS